MAWTTPKTNWAALDVPAASQLNDIGNNLAYLLAPVGSSGRRDNGADYTTTSTTFVAVDSTNLAKTITLNGSAVWVTFNGTVICSGGATYSFDVSVDGTRWGNSGTEGIAGAAISTSQLTAGFSVLIDGLSAASHTFQLHWKVSAGTLTLRAGSGVALTDFIPSFNVREA